MQYTKLLVVMQQIIGFLLWCVYIISVAFFSLAAGAQRLPVDTYVRPRVRLIFTCSLFTVVSF
jgi:hypothetical protein